MAAPVNRESSSPGEKKSVEIPAYSTATGNSHQNGVAREENFYTRTGLNIESFKRRDYGTGVIELERSMKPRHLHMIAIGGSIGAGFFVGSGSALSTGGPASLLIDFIIIGIMMFNVGKSPLSKP
jgi:amino acid transporter